MFHGASGLGVARGRNKKGTGVPAALRFGVRSLHSPVALYRRLHGKAPRTSEPERHGTGMLTSHGEKFTSQPRRTQSIRVFSFLPFFPLASTNCSIKGAANETGFSQSGDRV